MNGVMVMYVDYKEVGKRISARRKELGLKQREVTELAEMSDKYLSNIERATSVISIDVLMKLCAVLNSTPNDFLLGSTTSATDKSRVDYYASKISELSEEKKILAMGFIDWLNDFDILSE